MCEIAIIDPRQMDVESQFNLLLSMFDQNDDGLGIVAVTRDGGGIQTETVKMFDPEWVKLGRWLDNHQTAWRLFMHCRLATHGEKGVRQSHPLAVDCPECSVNQVIHNGVVMNHGRKSDRLNSDGHEYGTAVDSETIAHAHGTLPDDVDDVSNPRLTGRLTYVVFGRDRILIRTSNAYKHDDGARLAKHKRDYPVDGESGRRWILVKPDEIQTAPVAASRVTRKGHASGATSTVSADTAGNENRGTADMVGNYSRAGSGKYCPECHHELPEGKYYGRYFCPRCNASIHESSAVDDVFSEPDDDDDGEKPGVLTRITETWR